MAEEEANDNIDNEGRLRGRCNHLNEFTGTRCRCTKFQWQHRRNKTAWECDACRHGPKCHNELSEDGDVIVKGCGKHGRNESEIANNETTTTPPNSPTKPLGADVTTFKLQQLALLDETISRMKVKRESLDNEMRKLVIERAQLAKEVGTSSPIRRNIRIRSFIAFISITLVAVIIGYLSIVLGNNDAM